MSRKLGDLLPLAVLFFVVTPSFAVADLVYDTTSDWIGNVVSGWEGSGQSFTVPFPEDTLESIVIFIDQAAVGQTFDFELKESLNGSITFFETSFVVVEGANVINIDEQLPIGFNVYAHLDYNGYTGLSTHFIPTDPYDGGDLTLFEEGSSVEAVGLDLSFVATFSSVPEPSSAVVLMTVLLGAGANRRRT